MPRPKVCACGQPIPPGRRKHCSEACMATAWRTAADSRAADKVGAERFGRVFLPGHPAATQSSWVWRERLAAYEARGGVCKCDASGEPLAWAEARVVAAGGGHVVLCSPHNRVRSFGEFVASGVWGGVDCGALLDGLEALMASPCPAVGGVPADREAGTGQVPPLGGPCGSHPPVTVGRL